MSLSEYWGWNQFVALEPFPAERMDLAGALVATTMANLHRGKGAVRKLEEFMLIQRILEKQVVPSIDREEAHLRATIVSLGGKISV